jgi:hypothetical protein
MNDTKKPKKVKVGITLIVIGILIIIGGIVGYNVEKATCPPEFPSGCGFFTSAGGLGLMGLIFLGSILILVAILKIVRI